MKSAPALLVMSSFLLLASCLKGPKTSEYQNFNPISDDGGTISQDDVPILPAPSEADPVKGGREDNKQAADLADESTSVSEVPIAETPEEMVDTQNLNFMLDILFDFSIGVPAKNLEQLHEYLTLSALSPSIAVESNPYTGSLTMVRNFKNLRGTRYFVAQYTGSENAEMKDTELQHMSFEFRPGKTSWARVRRAVELKNPLNGKPYINEDTLLAWHLSNGYHIYISILDLDDIRDNPYNVYFPSDIGTIKIAVEKDPHVTGDDYYGEEDFIDHDDSGNGEETNEEGD